MKPISVSVVLLTAFTVANAYAANLPKDLIGSWYVESSPASADITAMSAQQAKQLIGKTLIIQSHQISFDKAHCAVDDVQDSKEQTSIVIGEGFKMGGDDIRSLGLGKEVRHVDTGCFDLFVKPNGHLLFSQGNYFFEAKKIN